MTVRQAHDDGGGDLVDVYLHGPLGDRFGQHHRFAVATPVEAVRALEANYPGFVAAFAECDMYLIHADGDWRGGDVAARLAVHRNVHFVPVVQGRGPLIGAGLAALIPALGTTMIFGVSAASIIGGVLFAGLLIGVSFLLAPKPPEETGDEERDENYAFTGPENLTMQGVAVPLIYGRAFAGSVVVSAGLEVAQLEVAP